MAGTARSLFVTLVRKSLGLPTGSTACCSHAPGGSTDACEPAREPQAAGADPARGSAVDDTRVPAGPRPGGESGA